MDDPFSPSSAPGFRLHKVQIMNWGTFDSTKGQIHTVRPDGRTSLLIGQNGSGKSTLVDALLTLLVRPGVRNYNVAAGSTGGKRERDERSYLLGAYGHASSDADNRASTLFLRAEGRTLSVLLAYFENTATCRGFTIAQLLYAGADGKVEKIFCFAREEKDIATGFAGLKAVDQIVPTLEARGFKTTRAFVQYQKWFISETKMRGKGMDIFNQTVAVKDIRSLTEFIRSHMLESHDWKERIDGILNHFQQLSDAHQMLVSARDQLEALRPIAAAGVDYQNLRRQLEQRLRVERAADAFFRQRSVDLFSEARERKLGLLAGVTRELEALASQIEQTDDQVRRLQNDVENAGGERLRSIPYLVQQKEADSKRRRERAERFRRTLAQIGAPDPLVADEGSFAATLDWLRKDLTVTEARIEELDQTKLGTALHAHQLNQQREQIDAEIRALAHRSSSLPENLQTLRRTLCLDLGLELNALPYAAELIGVREDQSGWQSAAEVVLRGFGQSLLVPNDHYEEVSGHLNQRRLIDAHGRGQKLVYHRTSDPDPSALSRFQALPPTSLLAKLRILDEHPLAPWLKGELLHRFNFHCCESVEELQSHRAMALTSCRLVKLSPQRHEKDDRDHVVSPRHFILGWNNQPKLQALRQELQRTTEDLQRALVAADQQGEELRLLRDRVTAIRQALEQRSFAEVDFARVDRDISALLREKEALESADETISVATSQLQAALARKRALKQEEALLTKQLGVLEREIAQAESLIAHAQKRIEDARARGEWEVQKSQFPTIQRDLEQNNAVLNADNVAASESTYMAALRVYIDSLRSQLEPVEKSLLQCMSKFLRKFRHFEQDLREDPAYLNDFIALHDRLEREDLPKHEHRFKERLNEKVTTELGILHNQLYNERAEIIQRIETLNRCLQTIDYDPIQSSFMQLEPKVVRDKEIEEFQSLLKESLDDAFDGSFAANEVRFQRIEGLLSRLREEPRWCEKVTDVRRWFDFGARETNRRTGQELGYYSDSMGQSGGEKAKLAFTILVAAVVYQFDIDPAAEESQRFHFVVVDEMFSKIDDRYADYAMRLFQKFGLQLLIVAPFDAKAKVTEPFVDYYMHVVKKGNRSRVLTMTSAEFQQRFGSPSSAEPLPSIYPSTRSLIPSVPPPPPLPSDLTLSS